MALWNFCYNTGPYGGGGSQAYSLLSTTHDHIIDCWIRWCMQVYACELIQTCLVWAEQSTLDSFLVTSHRFNSAMGEQKGITQIIYTDSELPSRLPNSFMPSTKLRSANLPMFTSLVWRGQGSNPSLPHPERTLLTSMLCEWCGGRTIWDWKFQTLLLQFLSDLSQTLW